MNRIGKLAFSFVCAILLCAGKMPLYELPDTVVPNDQLKLNERRTALPGDDLLSASVVQTSVLILEARLSAKITRFETSLAAGDHLSPMFFPPESTELIASGAEVFCGKQIQSRSKLANSIWGNWFSKYDSNVRFCFVDSDHDQRLDRVLLGGSFDKELQAGYAIEPVPYRIQNLRPEAIDDGITIRYKRFRKSKIDIEVSYRKNGTDLVPSGYRTPSHMGSNAYRAWYQIDINKKPMPVKIDDVMGSQIQIDSVNNEGKIEYRVIKNMEKTLIKPYFVQIYTFYVYY